VCCLPCGSFLYCCVFVILLVLEVGLVLEWWVFGVVAPECGCEGGIMAGGFLEELQRSCWAIWCGHRLNGYCLSVLRKCKNVILCWGVTLCFAVAVFALCYGWSRMHFCVHWTLHESLYQFAPHTPSCNWGTSVCILWIMCICLVPVVCALVNSGHYCWFEMQFLSWSFWTHLYWSLFLFQCK